MLTKRDLIVGLTCFFFLFSVALAQQAKKPLSLEDIEQLFRIGVSSKGVTRLLDERGVNFEVTEDVKERLRKAGADATVMQAVEGAGLEFARRRYEKERQKAGVDVAKAQRLLKARGFDPGPPDGIPGARTRDAVLSFQQAAGARPDGEISDDLVRQLTASLSKRSEETERKEEKSQRAKRPLSLEDIERLLKRGVGSGAVARLIDKGGIRFEVSGETRDRLRKAGAGLEVVGSLEKIKLERERRKLEEERKRAEEEIRKLEEETRRAEEERRRLEKERRRVKREKRGAEQRRRIRRSSLTIASLTTGVRNSHVFPRYRLNFSQGFETVWAAVNRVLQEGGDRVGRSDPESGAIITDLTVHHDGFFPRYDQYYILVQEQAAGSTKVSFKLFTYFGSILRRGKLKPSKDVIPRAKRFIKRLETVLTQSR